MPEALGRLADRLLSELDATAVVITLGDPVNATATSGDGESAALAGLSPPRIMSGGTLPTESHPAKPGRWIKVVGPIRRPSADQGLAQTTAVRTSDGSNAGSITLVRGQDAERSLAVDDRLLSTVAHQLGQAMERIRLQHEATDAEVLVRTDEVRTAMMNEVSHDLRTPLASIIATGGNLLARELEWSADERRELMETIVMEAKRLDRMVGGLLDLSRIEAGALTPNRTLHDLPSLINEAIGRLELAYPEAEFSLEVSPALPPVPLDYVEIEQVVTNLLENAVRHGGGVVSISVTKDAGDVRVCVEDAGPGIVEDDLPHVFRAFEVRSEADGGTGLGLAIAKGFVSAHGGRIWAENLRKGARFAFTLPLSVEPARTATK
jgi:two-component system sensor histidine kinase KdpD